MQLHLEPALKSLCRMHNARKMGVLGYIYRERWCRHMMGLNSDGRSYFAGVALDNAASPQRAIIRPAAGPTNPGEGGGNPSIPEGALVNGPDTSGVYQVTLFALSTQHTGASHCTSLTILFVDCLLLQAMLALNWQHCSLNIVCSTLRWQHCLLLQTILAFTSVRESLPCLTMKKEQQR